jgi:hypothetical protein
LRGPGRQLDNHGASINDPIRNSLRDWVICDCVNESMKRSANIFGNTLARLPSPVFQDAKHRVKIFQGDCLEILALVPDDCVDLIFADPPYFLSNGGITCHAGRMVSVNKGEWDRSPGCVLASGAGRVYTVTCYSISNKRHR